jgi:hypothetical protein
VGLQVGVPPHLGHSLRLGLTSLLPGLAFNAILLPLPPKYLRLHT